VVTRLAEDHGIDLPLVRGTGIDGRVSRRDVLRYIENPAANTVPPASHEGVVGARGAVDATGRPPAAPAHAPAQASDRMSADGDRTLLLTPMRRTIAARMLESHTTIPAAWMSVEADVTGLVALRDRMKARFAETEGVALTYMPFFVQAIVGALKQHPQVNASYADGGITLHAAQHIGIAVATEAGLAVPVVRDAGEKSIAGLAREVDALAGKARARKLSIDEMRGATLTIDNTGVFGSVLSMPILPVGQVAIITTETIRRELRSLETVASGVTDAFGVRSIMNLCITIDHRALDGAEAGAFMRDVKLRLESYGSDDVAY
jgi:2-oxoisovalerate dehydrogenase E2 component (dihydrolipoyl transacylase)